MITRRKILIAFGAGVLALPLRASAQGKVWRIGFLAVRPRPSTPEADVYSGFMQGMRELGYVEGKNFVLEWRYADGKYDRLAGLAVELVNLKADLIVTAGTAATRAAQQATGTIPIVAAAMIDPVGGGFALSLARPGRNITGLSLTTTDASPKQLELLKLMLPKLTRVAVLSHPANPGHPEIVKALAATAQKIGIKVLLVEARNPDDVERGFATMKTEHAEAVIVVLDAFFIGQRKQLADLALKNRLPSLFSALEHVEAGGLMSYGQNITDFYRRAAGYADKILKGAKPGELPIEQPTTFALTINRKTAKALGLAIPSELMLRADKVIE